MRPPLIIVTLLGLLGLAAPVTAQIAVPGIELPGPGQVLDTVREPLERPLDQITGQTTRIASELLRERERNIAGFLRRNRKFAELDRSGFPARRGELLLIDAGPEAIAALAGQGFSVLGNEEIEGLGFVVTRIAVPADLDLAQAQEIVAVLLPDASVAADNIHFQSGHIADAAAWQIAATQAAGASRASAVSGVPVGMIDGTPATGIGTFTMRGFAKGAPTPSNHGSAIASLLMRQGTEQISVADVYGTDPAGGSALAIARGLGWLVEGGSKVVTISLVGPRNAVLERAIAAAQTRGTVVVAAVGNDGPAAPPAYPASYTGVVAVTAVDGHKRALIEAGRALHLDYAAPGADLTARNAKGRSVKVRGTSFATPLVAARIARALSARGQWRTTLDAEAEDLGEKGPDAIFGRGLVCGACGRN